MNYKKNIRRLVFGLLAFQLVSTTVIAEEGTKKIKPKLRLSYVKEMGNGSKLIASAYYKLKKVKTPCDDAVIGFYSSEDGEGLIKKIPTDNSGVAVLSMNSGQLASFKDSTGKFHFFAQVEPSDKYKRKTADLEISDAKLEVRFLEGDPANYIEAVFTKVTDSVSVPTEKLPLKFLVKRALSMLSIGEEINYTNASGTVKIEFPGDLPGDSNGIVTLIVMLEEDDEYGTVKYEDEIDWGIPVEKHRNLTEGTLISGSHKAPLFMRIGIYGTLAVIWGFIMYIIFGLIKIKRLSKQSV